MLSVRSCSSFRSAFSCFLFPAPQLPPPPPSASSPLSTSPPLSLPSPLLPAPPPFLCKTSLRAVHAILRHSRAGVLNLRIYSEGGAPSTVRGGGSSGSTGEDSDTDDGTESGAVLPLSQRRPAAAAKHSLCFSFTHLEKIRTTHRVPLSSLPSDTVVPVTFSNSSSLSCPAGVLSSLLNHFKDLKGEATMVMDPGRVTLESRRREGGGEKAAKVATRAALSASEFHR